MWGDMDLSPYLPISPRISPYLPISPHISRPTRAARARAAAAAPRRAAPAERRCGEMWGDVGRSGERCPCPRRGGLLSRQRDQRGEGVAGCGARRGRDGGDERTQSGLHARPLAVRRESSARAAELRGGRKGAHLCPRVARAQQLRQRVRRAAARRLPQHENAAAPRARRAAHRCQCRVARACSGRLELPPERAEQSSGGERLVRGAGGVKSAEMWGDMGRYGEIWVRWGDVGRERWGEMGRDGERWGEMGSARFRALTPRVGPLGA